MHYLCVQFRCHGEIASFKDPEHSPIGGQHFRFEPVYAFFTGNHRKMPHQTAGNALSMIFLLDGKIYLGTTLQVNRIDKRIPH